MAQTPTSQTGTNSTRLRIMWGNPCGFESRLPHSPLLKSPFQRVLKCLPGHIDATLTAWSMVLHGNHKEVAP